MTQNHNDDLNAFRKFIEDELDLSALPEEDTSDPFAKLDEGRKLYGLVTPSLDRAKLEQDIQRIWTALQKTERAGLNPMYLVTPIEEETRSILRELILASLRPNVPALSDDQLRDIISYSITSGWLVLASLLSQYEDGFNDSDDSTDDSAP